MVACPQGRKPPVVQDIENYSPGKFSDGGGDHAKRRASTGFSDDDEGNPSAVARAIKQFESKNPRKNEFLERRDSLEKARNSLRLYKEKKRSSMFGGGSTGSPGTPSSASSGPSPGKVSVTTTPAKKRSEDVARSHGLGGSLDSLTSPRMKKASAFSMPDPKSVSIITPNRSQKLSRLGGSFDENEAGTPASEAQQVSRYELIICSSLGDIKSQASLGYINSTNIWICLPIIFLLKASNKKSNGAQAHDVKVYFMSLQLKQTHFLFSVSTYICLSNLLEGTANFYAVLHNVRTQRCMCVQVKTSFPVWHHNADYS